MAKSMKSFVCASVFSFESLVVTVSERFEALFECASWEHGTQFSHWSSERVQMQLAFGKQSLHILVYVTFNLLLAERSIETPFRGWYPYVRHNDRALILSEDSLAVSRTKCSVCVGGRLVSVWNNIHLKSIERLLHFGTTKASALAMQFH